MVQPEVRDESHKLPQFITFQQFQDAGYFMEFIATRAVMFDTDGYGLTGEGLICATHQEYLAPTGKGFKCPIQDCPTSVMPK